MGVTFASRKHVIMLREWDSSTTDKETTFPREMLNVKHTHSPPGVPAGAKGHSVIMRLYVLSVTYSPPPPPLFRRDYYCAVRVGPRRRRHRIYDNARSIIPRTTQSRRRPPATITFHLPFARAARNALFNFSRFRIWVARYFLYRATALRVTLE